MEKKDQIKEPLQDKSGAPRRDRSDAPEQHPAPIEREHETYAGILEEDEHRKNERK